MTEPANNYQTADQASIEGLEDLLEIVATDADSLTTDADIVVTDADRGKWVRGASNLFKATTLGSIVVVGILSLGLVSCAPKGTPTVQKEVIEEGVKPNEATQGVLDQLKAAGSNLRKPHHLEFQFYFPTRVYNNDWQRRI